MTSPALAVHGKPEPTSPHKSAHALLSLFCGAGGLDLGFSMAGFQIGLALDNMSAAVNSFNRNHTDNVAQTADIAELGVHGLLQRIREKNFVPMGVIGGPPCQGFSVGNVHNRGRQDPRNDLPITYSEIVAAVAEVYPVHFFLFENVPGLLQAKHSNCLNKMRMILSPLFHITEHSVNAVDFGVPQKRRRILWIGRRHDSIANFKWTEQPAVGGPAKTVRETVGLLPEPTFCTRSTRTSSSVITNSYHPNHWTMRPLSHRFQSGEFGNSRSFRKLNWDTPSPTVAYGNREIHVHPNGNRRLSVLEAMLLQGFPASWVLYGSLSEQITQVCNAVPPPLAQYFAAQLYKQIEDWERQHANK